MVQGTDNHHASPLVWYTLLRHLVYAAAPPPVWGSLTTRCCASGRVSACPSLCLGAGNFFQNLAPLVQAPWCCAPFFFRGPQHWAGLLLPLRLDNTGLCEKKE